MDWILRDECGLLYDRIAWALGIYNMVRERLILLPFFFWRKTVKNGKEWYKMAKNESLPWPIGA